MEEPEDMVEGQGQDGPGHGGRALVPHPRLDDFQIPVAEVAPEEIAGRADGGRGVISPKLVVDVPDDFGKAGEDPAVLLGQVGAAKRLEGVLAQVLEHEPGRVPQLGAESPADLEPLADDLGRRKVGHRPEDVEFLPGLGVDIGEDRASVLGRGQVDELAGVGRDRLDRKADVLRPRLHVAEDIAHGVRPVFLDDVLGIDAVALALGHPLALAVLDVGVDEACR